MPRLRPSRLTFWHLLRPHPIASWGGGIDFREAVRSEHVWLFALRLLQAQFESIAPLLLRVQALRSASAHLFSEEWSQCVMP